MSIQVVHCAIIDILHCLMFHATRSKFQEAFYSNMSYVISEFLASSNDLQLIAQQLLRYHRQRPIEVEYT